MSEELIDVADGANALLLGGSDQQTERCCDALLDVGSADRRGELSVTFSEDVTDRERLDTGSTGRQSAKRGHITVGDVLRSADDSAPSFEEPVATDIVEDPADLKGLGTSVSQFCEAWADSGHLMVLCFDSLSELLDHRDPQVVFQFLHTLLERLSSVDTVAHFHLDPAQFDDQTVATFGSLFDEVIDPETATDLVDESALEDAESSAEDDDGSPSLSNGIPATSGSRQASDGDIAARLDAHGEEYEVADGGRASPSTSAQASDDDIATQIPDVDDAESATQTDDGGDADAGRDDAGRDTGSERDDADAASSSDEDGADSQENADDEDSIDADDLDFDFG
ncbi:hypothetical protein SAMN06269185_1563 [Natronoarchaeum philippinense]|uniref:RecA-superfamily ATPase, KaiC/GvpD/RAD55 family n=1 Tax=Natronoarchaeum philippinense TaxID=558529 RepID=A0A285NTK1_NATPI|nr:hypothetical protein [Natronoarchaeum philippinense]SNZ12233.1 hypothetical protein SAMN06269185_1563 [Natronoarchaeum philippinense]